jgi:hypothetical protein
MIPAPTNVKAEPRLGEPQEGRVPWQRNNSKNCPIFEPREVGVKVNVTEHPLVVVMETPGTQVVCAMSTANAPSWLKKKK